MGLRSLLKNFVFRLRGEYTLEQLQKMGLSFGRNFNPQQGYYLDPSHCWLITIGDDVTFGPRVQLFAHDASMHLALGYTKIAPIVIGDRVFIGAGSIILPGVHIGNDCIIGAGSVVVGDIPSGTVYAGNPACKICNTDEFLAKHQLKMAHCMLYDESYTLRQNVSAEKKNQQKKELSDSVGYIV